MMQVLPPTVEHCQEADPSAEVFPVGRNLQKSFGSRTEQQVINDSLILQCQWCQFLGQREDEVKIRCRKKLFGSFVKPFLPGAELALRAMSISARVVGDHGMTALVAFRDDRRGPRCGTRRCREELYAAAERRCAPTASETPLDARERHRLLRADVRSSTAAVTVREMRTVQSKAVQRTHRFLNGLLRNEQILRGGLDAGVAE